VDYVATDAYYQTEDSLVGLLQDVYNYNVRFKKPQFVSEYGGTPYGGSEQLLAADLHNGIWIGYHIPFGAAPLYFWHNFVEDKNLFRHYRALAEYAFGEDRVQDNLLPVPVNLSPPAAKAVCLKNDRKALLWFYTSGQLTQPPQPDSPVFTNATSARLEGFVPGTYFLEFWDTYAGGVFDRSKVVSSDGSIAFQLPLSNKDFALKIRLSE
jgi:hypothetical protein